MKKLFAIASMSFIFFESFSQELILPLNNENQVEYSNVIELDSTQTKNILYQKALTWVATTYNSANNVIQNKDAETGIINIVAKMPIGYYSLGQYLDQGYLQYNFSIFLKDGKYKYEINNIHHTPLHSNSMNYGTAGQMYRGEKNSYKKINFQMLTTMDNNIKALILSLNKSLSQKQKDW